MATPERVLQRADQSDRGGIFTWIATVVACAYIGWSGTALYLATPSFINMFNSMGLELHGPVWFLMRTYHWSYPILFAGPAAVVFAKQFYVRQKWINISITLAAVLVVDIVSRGIVSELYRPLFEFSEKVNK